MGEFVAISGVIGANAGSVIAVIASFASLHGGGSEPIKTQDGGPNIGVIGANGANVSVLYPDHFLEWDDASSYLSSELHVPVFSLHIHDGDLWMFVLFREGKEVGWFNTAPGYWGKVSEDEMQKWKGDAYLICSHVPKVSPEAITNYLVRWDDETTPRVDKAYPDDEFEFGDCWQMTDFMKRLGLEYPIPSEGTMTGLTFRLWTKLMPLEKPDRRKY